MEFELAIAAEDAGAVSRLKALAACRNGRSRSQAIRTIWHDSPDRALLEAGQTLVETRGAWRLERLFPGPESWLPGQPPPVLAEAADLAALPVLPSPLAPLAAFEGRRTVSVHGLAGGSVSVTIERGVLRAVTAERAAARLRLSGDEAAVREAALTIADAVPVRLPAATLAAEGIALATGWTPPSRRSGAPELPDEARAVPAALAHIMGHLLDVVLARATELHHGPEAVHQMRVSVRRARSAVSLFRPAFTALALEPMHLPLKTLNAQLGPTRDWDVFTGETLPEIQAALPDDERLGRLAKAAGRRRRDYHRALDAWLGSGEYRRLTIEFACTIAGESWRTLERPLPLSLEAGESEPPAAPPEPDLSTFAAAVLQKRWKRLVSAGKGMEDLDAAGLHTVRLRAKRTRYAAEMFAALYDGKGPHRFIHRLSVLQQRLGVLNDGAVASALLEELGGASGRFGYATGVVIGFLAARGARLRPKSTAAFAKFRRQPTYWA
ncbi:MAG TPA: CHAD domain-containing protein [Rhodopila sp.]|nr:CHAD domain-containing protein [Rhodopila sp.]